MREDGVSPTSLPSCPPCLETLVSQLSSTQAVGDERGPPGCPGLGLGSSPQLHVSAELICCVGLRMEEQHRLLLRHPSIMEDLSFRWYSLSSCFSSFSLSSFFPLFLSLSHAYGTFHRSPTCFPGQGLWQFCAGFLSLLTHRKPSYGFDLTQSDYAHISLSFSCDHK